MTAEGGSTPLTADTSRQAIDSLRGYDYQIWRSVDAWMRLDAAQILYLEGAEDFDIVDETGDATTSQIKNSAKNITLGSGDVRDAIENFWAHTERNPGRSIRMRFVTRGGVGSEKGDPFGKAKGIELWRAAATGDDAAATQVARYLSSTLKSSALLSFLGSADASELRSALFGRIVWATSEPSTEAIRFAVEQAVIDFGDERDIDHNEALKAVDGFLAHCMEAIKRRDPNLRCVTHADLLKVFEAKTSVMVPLTRGVTASIAQALAATRGTSSGLPGSISFSSATLGVEPELPQFCLPRAVLVAEIMQAGSPALIVGSEGRGKTTVASLVGKKIGTTAYWVDLSAFDAAALPSVFDHLALNVRNLPPRTVVVVDDFPVANTITQAVWSRFVAVSLQCSKREQFLVLTAKGVNPEAIDPRLRTSQIQLHAVPDLSLDEITEFVSSLGCPAGQAPQFAETILAQSGGGHPKLAHLLGLELQRDSWRNPPAVVMGNPPASLEEARAFARRKAANMLSDLDLELLYSLSLALCALDRKAIIFIGERFLGLRSPGDTLDRLVGHWVEAQASHEYKVTALLAQQAKLAWSAARVAQAHESIFDALVSGRTISFDKAFAMFLHAWESGDDTRLSNFLASLIDEKRALRGAAAEILTPIVFVCRGSNPKTNGFKAKTIALLRLTQFRIAKQQIVTELSSLASSWENDIARIDDVNDRNVHRLSWAMSIADSPGHSFAASTLVRALAEIDRLEPLAADEPVIDRLSAELAPGGVVKDADLVAALFGFNFARLQKLDQLIEMVDALESADSKARGRMLKAFNIPLFSKNHFFVQGPWQDEANREAPRWGLVEETLVRMLGLAGRWNAKAMGVSIARLLSVLYEDHLSRGDEALTCLKRAAETFGEAPILIAQEATVHFGRKNFRQALSLWRRSLWRPSSSDVELERDPHVLRKAGIAAGNLGDFGGASEWFEFASRSASDSGMAAMAGGALFDAAYCAFKDGKRSRVVSLIVEGLNTFDRDFDPTKQFELFAAKKLGGHVLRWILEQLRGKFEAEPIFEPVVGQCSNPGRDKGIADHPKLPSAMAAAFVVEIASLLRLKSDGVDALRSGLSETRILAAGFQFWSLRCNELIGSGELEQLSSALYHLNEYFWRHRALQRRQENGMLSDSLEPFDGEILEVDRSAPMGMESVFGLALFLRAISGGSINTLASEWISDLSELPHSAMLLNDAREALRAISVDSAEAPKVAATNGAKPIDRLGAVFRILIENDQGPESTAAWQIRAVHWLSILPSKIFLDAAFNPLAKAFSIPWRTHTQNRALLRLPNLTVPMLKEAIEQDENAPDQLARLLRAASLATSAQVPQAVLDLLDQAATLHRARLPW
ncbi:hypothetical protein [Paraburkholderia ferrariae]|uniref:hypothetical protein n=1 Tax=Paraburkholderia ferrariae TaxID=386056 RepID=UPI0012EBF88C|nr:hypothetical protein [Paraburkholderia ferrariae]